MYNFCTFSELQYADRSNVDALLTTYSMWNDYRNCPRKCKIRYFDKLVPIEQDHNLAFGSVIHDCLESWHRDRDLPVVLDIIDRSYPNRLVDEKQNAAWHMATAMMMLYAQTYPEDYDVVALEKTFESTIVHPRTGDPSIHYRLGGKVDGILEIDNELFLFEHKTTAQINAAYLDRLWTDFQVILYSVYMARFLKKPIVGVVYNILTKPKLKQGKGETEKEFEERKAKLIAKSKTGKTNAKRKEPESDEDFQFRLQEKLKEPGMFHRELCQVNDILSIIVSSNDNDVEFNF